MPERLQRRDQLDVPCGGVGIEFADCGRIQRRCTGRNLGMTSKRVSREAALASSIGGVLVTCVWIVGAILGASWAGSVHPGVVGLSVAGALMLAVSLFTAPVKHEAISKYFPEAS